MDATLLREITADQIKSDLMVEYRGSSDDGCIDLVCEIEMMGVGRDTEFSRDRLACVRIRINDPSNGDLLVRREKSCMNPSQVSCSNNRQSQKTHATLRASRLRP